MCIPAGIAARKQARDICCAISGPKHKDMARAQDSDPLGTSRDLLEEQLRRRGACRGFSGAARVLRHRADRTVGQLIAEQMPANREVMDIVAARFNDVNALSLGPHHRFPEIALRAHANERSHSGATISIRSRSPSGLKNLLHLWKYQSPWFFDEFDRLEEVFPAASYQYVLYGMGFRTEVGPMDNADTRADGDSPAARKCGHDQKAAVAATEESRPAAQDSRARHAAHLMKSP